MITRLLGLVAVSLFSLNAHATLTRCVLTPENSFIAEGESIELSAQCDDFLQAASWNMNGISLTGMMDVNQELRVLDCRPDPNRVSFDIPSCAPVIKFKTPITLKHNDGVFHFSLSGKSYGPNPVEVESNTVKVIVKTFDTINWKNGFPNTTAYDGQCGTADGRALSTYPTNTELCSTGTPTIVLTSSGYLIWMCQGTNGGENTPCEASFASQ